MRPFLSRCVACNKVDYRFSIGIHCSDCGRLIKAFFWSGMYWADIRRRCLELGISFYKVFGNPFDIVDLDTKAPVIEIMSRLHKNVIDEINEAMDREMLQDLLKASNQ